VHAIQVFESSQGRRLDAKQLIEALRNRIRKHPPLGNLEGLVSQAAVQENSIAIGYMREHLLESRPDAVLAVERGGAFLAEVLNDGAAGFPATVTVPKSATPRPGQDDLVQRTPHLEAEIRRRIALGETRFAVVDVYMGGHFASELEAMFHRLQADFPDHGLAFEALWLRETHGYETLAGRRPNRAELEQGVVYSRIPAFTVSELQGERRLRIRLRSEGVTLPTVSGNAGHADFIRVIDFPVSVVLGDDMRTVFDPDSTHPIRIFDRSGRLVREIAVGTPDPVTGRALRNTREIMVRVMQGHFSEVRPGPEMP
jgi:hypothetical protein